MKTYNDKTASRKPQQQKHKQNNTVGAPFCVSTTHKNQWQRSKNSQGQSNTFVNLKQPHNKNAKPNNAPAWQNKSGEAILTLSNTLPRWQNFLNRFPGQKSQPIVCRNRRPGNQSDTYVQMHVWVFRSDQSVHPRVAFRWSVFDWTMNIKN